MSSINIDSKLHMPQYIILLFTLIFSSTIVISKEDAKAIWLRHSCGYTNGQQLLGGNAWGDAVAADQKGNSYNAGSFSGNWFTMDTIIDMNLNRFYINKYDYNGKRVWTSKIQGTTINSIISANKMLCDQFGNIYICGIMSVDDSAYLSPYWYPIGGGYIAKYDSMGNNVWCKYVARNSTTPISFTDMSIAGDKLYICGNMGYGTAIIDGTSYVSPTSQSSIIMKISLDGIIEHSEMLDTNTTTYLHGIEASPYSNAVYAVGEYLNGTLSKDGISLLHQESATNSMIIKMNTSFDVVWMRRGLTHIGMKGGIWGSDIKCLRSLELDSLENIYAIGNGNGDSTVFGSLKFNHFIPTSYAQDVYLVKYDKYGREQWLKHGGSGENDHAYDIITDKSGNSIIAVMSGFNSIYNFVFDNDSIQRYHGGLVSYDANGTLRYVKKLQEAKSLRKLTWGLGNSFYGTGTGIQYKMPYDSIIVTGCEDTIHGTIANFKLLMVKFQDERTSNPLHIDDETNTLNDNDIIIPFDDEIRSIYMYDISGKEYALSKDNYIISNSTLYLQSTQYKKGIYLIIVKTKQGHTFTKKAVL